MDCHSLAVILHAALSPNNDERNAAELSLHQCQYSPQHLVRVFQIIVDGSYDMAVRQMASIHFKNFIDNNWSSHNPQTMPSDKDMVRQNILLFIAQVPSLLRLQLGESLKTIIDADYPDQWSGLLHWVKQNLQEQQVYGALFVLMTLSRKYKFRYNGDRIPFNHIIEETFPCLLDVLRIVVEIGSTSLDVADLIKLICKIFWSSIYLEIPKLLLDPNVFGTWMGLLVNILDRPVPVERQPADLELRKSWGWWKVKIWTVRIFNRIYLRYGDTKLGNTEYSSFSQMFQKTHAENILTSYLNLLNTVRVGGYLPDRVTTLILQYVSHSLPKNNMYNLLQPRLDAIQLDIVFPLMCFNDNDQKIWDEDPREYVRKGYDIFEDTYSPRAAAADFLRELVKKRPKDNLQKFAFFVGGIFSRYDEAPLGCKPYRQKDGALFALGMLCAKLTWTHPYKFELERLLVQHVIPEFSSPLGHLRSRAAWVAGRYAHARFLDQDTFPKLLQNVVSVIHDPELPVRVSSVLALRPFAEVCKDLKEIESVIPLLDEFFELMIDVESEDLVYTLEHIADKFGEQMAPYALKLCQNLAATFWNCLSTAEADEGVKDSGAFAAKCCLRTISVILDAVKGIPQIFIDIEPAVIPIIRRMLISKERGIIDEVLDIILYMTSFLPTFSSDMLSVLPLIMEAFTDWAMDYFPAISIALEKYISRSTSHFLTCKESDHLQGLWNIISSIMGDKSLGNRDIELALKLIEALFQNCKGKVDHWVEPYLKLTVNWLLWCKERRLRCLLMQVIADALYYDALLTLGILQNLGVASELFNLWLEMLPKSRKSKKKGARAHFKRKSSKKLCCLGLTSLLALKEEQFPQETSGCVFRAVLDVLVAYKEQITEDDSSDDEEEEDENDNHIDGVQDRGHHSDKGKEVMAEDEQSSNKQVLFTSYDEDDDVESYDFLSDDEELKSPVEAIDPFVYFEDTTKALQTRDPVRYQSLAQTLDCYFQMLGDSVAQYANERRQVIAKVSAEAVIAS